MVHYIDGWSSVESSINWTASAFLFGSRTYSSSATAALCIKESALKNKMQHKLTAIQNMNVQIEYKLDAIGHLPLCFSKNDLFASRRDFSCNWLQSINSKMIII